MAHKIELLKPHPAFPGKKVGAKITIDPDLAYTARNLVCTGHAKWVGKVLQRAERAPTRSGVLGTEGMRSTGAKPEADDGADE